MSITRIPLATGCDLYLTSNAEPASEVLEAHTPIARDYAEAVSRGVHYTPCMADRALETLRGDMDNAHVLESYQYLRNRHGDLGFDLPLDPAVYEHRRQAEVVVIPCVLLNTPIPAQDICSMNLPDEMVYPELDTEAIAATVAEDLARAYGVPVGRVNVTPTEVTASPRYKGFYHVSFTAGAAEEDTESGWLVFSPVEGRDSFI